MITLNLDEFLCPSENFRAPWLDNSPALWYAR